VKTVSLAIYMLVNFKKNWVLWVFLNKNHLVFAFSTQFLCLFVCAGANPI